MSLIYKAIEKHINYNAFHNVCEKYNELIKLLDNYNIPPIGGKWKLCLLNARYKDAKALQEILIPDFVDITLYLPKEALVNLGVSQAEPTAWELYTEYLRDYPKPIDTKTMKELFYGLNRDLDMIFTVLEKLLDDPNVTKIDHNAIQNYLSYESNIYPSDVVYSVLSYKRGLDAFKRYRRKPIYYIVELESLLGKEYAYFAVRKYVQKLFKLKLKYLNNEKVECNFMQKHVLREIDIYELFYMNFLLQTSHSGNLLILLDVIERRKQGNVCLFLKTLLTNQIECNNAGVW